jgi:hypothetical protein
VANLGFAYRLKRLAQIPLSESQPFARNAQNIQLIFRIQLTLLALEFSKSSRVLLRVPKYSLGLAHWIGYSMGCLVSVVEALG